MAFNRKDARIIKLLRKGIPREDIAVRLGYSGNVPDGLKRVQEALDALNKASGGAASGAERQGGRSAKNRL